MSSPNFTQMSPQTIDDHAFWKDPSRFLWHYDTFPKISLFKNEEKFFPLEYMGNNISGIMKFHKGILNINSWRKLALPGQPPQIAGSSGNMKEKHNPPRKQILTQNQLVHFLTSLHYQWLCCSSLEGLHPEGPGSSLLEYSIVFCLVSASWSVCTCT